MAKILYTVCGEGRGHATRSKAILDELKKKHTVHVVASEKAYDYLKDAVKPLTKTTGLNLFYRKNKVAIVPSIILNLVKLPKLLLAFTKTYRLIKRFKPDIVINDFDTVSAYVAQLLRIPIISLDNIQSIARTNFDRNIKKNNLFTYISNLFVVIALVPDAKRYIISSFFFPKINSFHLKNSFYVNPILRPEITKLKPNTKDYILIYQTSTTNKKLLPILRNLPQKFIIYGMKKRKDEENITFKQCFKDNFFQDLKNCNAVIINGGFCLLTEALYLQKPVFAIPVRGQFEQLLNAHYLKKLGYGDFSLYPEQEKLESFLSNLKKYKKNIKPITPGNKQALHHVEQFIRDAKKY